MNGLLDEFLEKFQDEILETSLEQFLGQFVKGFLEELLFEFPDEFREKMLRRSHRKNPEGITWGVPGAIFRGTSGYFEKNTTSEEIPGNYVTICKKTFSKYPGEISGGNCGGIYGKFSKE